MLYCPKCRRTYEDGTQRFCDNDGGRLLPASSGPANDSKSGGVFTNLLGKKPPPDETDDQTTTSPRLAPHNKTEDPDKKLTSFPSAGRIFQSEQFLKPKNEISDEAEDSILELEPPPRHQDGVLEFEPILDGEEESAAEETPPKSPKPLPRLVKPSEIASGTADVGNRRTNPLGREALSWENPEALVGQTVKGRYQIVEEIDADDDDESLIYVAEDKIVAGKRVVVRVFMNDYAGADEAEEKIFAEERVSLSHLKHPNIAGVFDSGELQEGNTFIVSEYLEGESLAEILQHTGQFNVLRTARIIRQTSYALSEAHQNGILHRNLKPENIILTVSDAGIEQVKLMNFGVSHGEITDSNLLYKAPEEIEKGISTYASDIYALAVIAYRMLTARLPFTAATKNALVKAQRQGLNLPPTNLRLDIQPLADRILEKALSFNPSARYPKARDFGDAFFNALTTVAPWTHDEEIEIEEIEDEPETEREFIIVPPIGKTDFGTEDSAVDADIHISPSADRPTPEAAEIKATEDLAWEKRSPEPPQIDNTRLWVLAISGLIVLILAFWGVSRFLLNRSAPPENTSNSSNQNGNVPPENASNNILPTIDGDLPPEARVQTTPPGTERFQNSRENLKGELAKNFLGFEIFYPQGWTRKIDENNFLDVSNGSAVNGTLVEQMIITRYESRGTMTLDRSNFPKLVEKSNQDLKKSLGENYRVVSEGETSIQNGRWKVYEVKFQSSGTNAKGENMTIWGKRLWLPIQRVGTQNGFVVTMLATSLSGSVKSVEDVGVQGELADVLETFEPEQR